MKDEKEAKLENAIQPKSNINKIVFATGNKNKMVEIRMILQELGIPIYSMKELGIEADIVEDGISFEENEDFDKEISILMNVKNITISSIIR